ncbi:hypothetical protein ACX27O_15010 [Micromonospora sp. SD19]
MIDEQEFGTWIDWLAAEGELRGDRPKPADLYTNRFNPFVDGGSA